MMYLPILCFAALAVSIASPVTAQQQPPASTNPFEGNPVAAQEGHVLFNETCSHCHGPDAVTPLSERNLRKLARRYGDQMAETFHTTVVNGRPEMGMPIWGGVIDEITIWKIYSYIETIQVHE